MCACVGMHMLVCLGQELNLLPAQTREVGDLRCRTWLQLSYSEFPTRLSFPLPPTLTGCGGLGPFRVQPQPHLSLWLWLAGLPASLAQSQGLQLFLIPFALISVSAQVPSPLGIHAFPQSSALLNSVLRLGSGEGCRVFPGIQKGSLIWALL